VRDRLVTFPRRIVTIRRRPRRRLLTTRKGPRPRCRTPMRR